jgi:hypothetical protein
MIAKAELTGTIGRILPVVDNSEETMLGKLTSEDGIGWRDAGAGGKFIHRPAVVEFAADGREIAPPGRPQAPRSPPPPGSDTPHARGGVVADLILTSNTLVFPRQRFPRRMTFSEERPPEAHVCYITWAKCMGFIPWPVKG